MAEHYRADHVGSLLRPPAVLEARATHAAGRLSLDQLRDIEDKAILEVLEMQRQAGIDVFTDGEYRRSWWSGAIAESVEGVIDDPDAVFTPGWQGPSGAQADTTAAEIGFAASKLLRSFDVISVPLNGAFLASELPDVTVLKL